MRIEAKAVLWCTAVVLTGLLKTGTAAARPEFARLTGQIPPLRAAASTVSSGLPGSGVAHSLHSMEFTVTGVPPSVSIFDDQNRSA